MANKRKADTPPQSSPPVRSSSSYFRHSKSSVPLPSPSSPQPPVRKSSSFFRHPNLSIPPCPSPLDSLLHPETIANILSPPPCPLNIQTTTQTTSPNVSTQCKLYFNPPLPPHRRHPPHKLNSARQSLADNTVLALTNLATKTPTHAPAVAALAAWNKALVDAEEKILDENVVTNATVIPQPECIIAHGGGSECHAIHAFASGFARTLPILTTPFPSTQSSPIADTNALRCLYTTHSYLTTLGGISSLARAATRAAVYSPIKKLILLSYPLVHGTEKRYEELLALESDVDVLFVSGEFDPWCGELWMREVKVRMRARSWWVCVRGVGRGLKFEGCDYEDGEHGNENLDEEESKRRTEALCEVVGQIAARWCALDQRDGEKTEMVVNWDTVRGVPRWTGWRPLVKDSKGSEEKI